jgi:carboxymethylenebutenolidase
MAIHFTHLHHLGGSPVKTLDRTEHLKTADGNMEVFIAHPQGSGPFPVVVQIMDALGAREELHEHARRVAAWGYYVLAPDLFYRVGLKGPIDLAAPEGMKKIMAAMGDLTDARATSDVNAVLELAARDKAAGKGKVGIYGFCMGGRLTLVLCQALGARVAAGASIHPGRLVVDQPDSPHRHLDQIRAELYFGIADKDQSATPEQMKELEAALDARKIRYSLEIHPDALHGFMMPSRPDMYHKGAAEKTWGIIEALFKRTLNA